MKKAQFSTYFVYNEIFLFIFLIFETLILLTKWKLDVSRLNHIAFLKCFYLTLEFTVFFQNV